jgi:hypothetical protein
MKLYEIGICLTLYRTVEAPDTLTTEDEISDWLNNHYTNNDVIIEAIDDCDFEINDFFFHQVGNHGKD